MVSRRRLIAGLAGLWLAGAAPGSAGYNEHVFARVWSLVRRHYWDKAMRGQDWDAVHARYRPRALAAATPEALYAVLNEMLGLLGDSHVYVALPVEEPRPGDTPAPEGRRVTRRADGLWLIGFDGFEPADDRFLAGLLAERPPPRGIILDLRGNGGGRADILDRIAGRFVASDRVIVRLSGRRTIEETTRGAGSRSWRGPLAVLTGPATASAAEILAAFLEAEAAAVTVGRKTKGAVMGGVDFDLPDGGRLTISEYDLHLADGRRLEGSGYTPRHITADGDTVERAAALLLNPPRHGEGGRATRGGGG